MTATGSDRTIQIGVEVDSSQAAQGLNQINQAAQSTAQNVARAGQQAGAGLNQIGAAAQRAATEVAQAGQRAGDGLARMGDGAPAAEQRITRSAQSIINSIERTTAALRSGGAQSAEYYQTLANQRGVNPSVLDPYIQRLRQAEAAQLAATQSMRNMGMSAQATAAAMRTVPAQFTDIVTSLQAGQNPLTVLLQQGGQLKDQFGGIGAAAKALGGYILGLINPFTVAAAAGLALAVAYEKGAGEARAFERALIVSGNQAGVTGAQLIGMAESVDKVAGTQAKAAEVLTLLASSGDVGSASFERFTIAAIAFEQAGGQAAEETVKAFQELGKEPLKAALKLNEAQGFLTASVYEQIKALESQGRTLEAAKVAQEAYAAALEQRTPAMQAQLGTLERGWLAVKNATKEAVDAMLSIGRSRDPLTQAREDLAKLQENQAGARSDNKARYQPAIDALSRQLLMLDKVAAAENERAKDQANEIRLVKEKAEWDKRGSEYLEKSAKRDKELIAEAVKGRELVNKGLITEAELKERLLGITEKYKEKEKKTATGRKPNEFAGEQEFAKLWAADFKKMRDEATKAEASMLGLSKAQEKLLMFLKSYEYQRASEPERQLVLEEAYAAIAFEQTEAAANAKTKALKEVEKANTDYVESLQKDAAAAGKRLGQLQEENAAAIIAAQANISLAEAVEQVAIARLQEQQAVEMSFGNEATVQAIQNEIDARRELQKEIRTKDTRKAQDDAAKDAKKEAESAAKEWEKSAEKIENTLTDALMRGFESGKGFAETFRDTIVNMFKTMILRPVVSAIMSPIAQSITGMIAPTAASAGTSLLGSAASSAASSALFGGTSLGALGSAFGEGFMATLGGSTIGGGGAAGLLAGGGAAGTGTAGMLGAAAPYALAAVAALAAIGAFRTTKTVGGGLQGTLGEGDITGYDLRRKSGYLLGGPDYSIRQTGVAAQSATLQKAYADMRTASVGMADALGLGSDAIKNFTTRLGSDLIHPDTGGLGLKLDGLKPEEVEAKIAAAMKGANDAIAAEVLGVKNTVVTTTTKMVEEAVGPLDEWGQATSKATKEVTESMESTSVSARKDLLPWMQRIVDRMGPTADALKQLYAYSDELLTAAGTGRDELVKIYAEGFKTGDIAGAGQAVADTLVASIEQTMVGGAAGQIFDIANRGIITPILDAMINGQTLSQALADGAIDATITKIKEKATALATVMNDPRIKELMDGLKTSLGGALGGGAAVNYTPQYQPPPTKAVDQGQSEAEKAADAKKITDDLTSKQAELWIEKLRAQGRAEEALALEREAAIKGMNKEQIALYDTNQQLQKQIDLLNKTNAQRAEYESLGVDLLRAQGREAEALAEQRRLDVKGMTDTEIELYDLNAARRAEIDSITKLGDLKSEYATLEINLLRAQGRESDAVAKQRELDIKGLDAAAVAQYDLNAARQAEIDGIERTKAAISDLWSTADSLASKFLSGADLSAYQRTRAATGLVDAGVINQAQVSGLVSAVAGMTSEQLKTEGLRLASGYDVTTEAGAKAANAILQFAGTLYDLQKAAEDASIDAALSAVGRAVDAEKEAITKAADAQVKALQDQIEASQEAAKAAAELTGNLEGMVKSVQQAARDLRGQSLTESARYDQAVAFVQTATVLGRMGARPDENQLADALRVLTSDQKERYATEADFALAQAKQAASVEALGGVLGEQLTDAQKQQKELERSNKLAESQIKSIRDAASEQIKNLDAIYKSAQDQIAVMRGVDLSVVSVKTAVEGLQTAIGALASRPSAIAPQIVGESVAASRSSAARPAIAPKIVGESVDASRSSAAQPAIAPLVTPAAAVSFDADVRAAAEQLAAAQGTAAVIAAVKDYGYTLSQANIILGLPAGTAEAEADRLGIPKFASGGWHSGGLALVGERGPELAFMPPAHIINATDTRQIMNGGGDGVAGKIESLERTVAELLETIATNTQRAATVLSDVTDSGTAMRLGETIA